MVTDRLRTARAKAPVTARAFQIAAIHIIGIVAPLVPAIFRSHTYKFAIFS
jgi:hypothetical protein